MMGLSQDPHVREICEGTGKERLAKGEAKSAAKRNRTRSNAGALQAYRCRFCRGWHVGTIRQRPV